MKIGFIRFGGIWELATWLRLFCRPRRVLRFSLPIRRMNAFIANFGGQASSNERILQRVDVDFLEVKPAQFSDLLAQYQTILEKQRVFF